MHTSQHTSLQNLIRARLLASGVGFGDYESQCPVIAMDDGDLLARIETAIGKIGVLAIAAVPKMNCTISSARPPIYDQISARVEIYENGILNRSESGTRIDALEWAERAASALHGWMPDGRRQELYLDPGASIAPEAHPDLVIYHVNLKIGKR